MSATKLIVVACSATKRDRPLPAFQLYDGPAWRTVRASGYPAAPRAALQLAALSALHGLISADRIIAPYDVEMDAARARTLQKLPDELVHEQLEAAADRPVGVVQCYGGRLYRSVVEAWADRGLFGTDTRVEYSSGGIGLQLGQLRQWLRHAAPAAQLQCL